MTPSKFETFIKKSGLKKTLVAENIGVPLWVLTKWTTKETRLSSKQQQKLDEFCNQFFENNAYMHV